MRSAAVPRRLGSRPPGIRYVARPQLGKRAGVIHTASTRTAGTCLGFGQHTVQRIDILRTQHRSRTALLQLIVRTQRTPQFTLVLLYHHPLLRPQSSTLLLHSLLRLLRRLSSIRTPTHNALSQVVIPLRVRQTCADQIRTLRIRDDEAEAMHHRVAADASSARDALLHQRLEFVVEGLPRRGHLLLWVAAVDVQTQRAAFPWEAFW